MYKQAKIIDESSVAKALMVQLCLAVVGPLAWHNPAAMVPDWILVSCRVLVVRMLQLKVH